MLKISCTLAVLAAAYSVSAAQRRNCPANYDVCGWSLTGTYGYTQNDLIVAAADGGVGVSAAYDSVYNCDDNGSISLSVQCGSGSCNAGVDGRTSAVCKGGEQGGDDSGDDGSDDGSDGNDVGDGSGGGGDSADTAPSSTMDAPLTTFVTTIIGRPTGRAQ